MSTRSEEHGKLKRRKPAFVIGVALAFISVTGFYLIENARQPTDSELAQRIAACTFTWQDYQEDIKKIGSALAAQWEGAPTAVTCNDTRLQATFVLSGPWAARSVAIPVLLRDSRGDISQSAAAQHHAGELIYTFELPDPSEALSWIELKYPHGQRRITLSQEKTWQAP